MEILSEWFRYRGEGHINYTGGPAQWGEDHSGVPKILMTDKQINAVLAREIEKACELMETHIMLTVEHLIDALTQED